MNQDPPGKNCDECHRSMSRRRPGKGRQGVGGGRIQSDNEVYARISGYLQFRVDAPRKKRGCRELGARGSPDHQSANYGGDPAGSVGILSEAAHSGLDLVAALLTFFSVRVSDKPADADHQYGHGKVESFSAFIETGLLLVTCVWIVYEAGNRLFFHSVDIEPSLPAFGV